MITIKIQIQDSRSFIYPEGNCCAIIVVIVEVGVVADGATKSSFVPVVVLFVNVFCLFDVVELYSQLFHTSPKQISPYQPSVNKRASHVLANPFIQNDDVIIEQVGVNASVMGTAVFSRRTI